MGELLFLPQAWEDYLYMQSHDRRGAAKINRLIQDCFRTPFSGIGKPEPLKFNWSGWWSRRIDGENRLVYKIEGKRLVIAQCRTHYEP